MTRQRPFIAYPSINNHGVTGDRRTAALIAADGTLDWLCLPNYDGATVFGALLDSQKGGYWRIGPANPITGEQRYQGNSPALVTSWRTDRWELELTDLMPWPEEKRLPTHSGRRVLIRRLRCTLGKVSSVMRLCPRLAFDTPAQIEVVDGGLAFDMGDISLGLWTSFPVTSEEDQVSARLEMKKGDDVWMALALNEAPGEWSEETVKRAFHETLLYWEEWLGGLTYSGLHARSMERSGLIIHLLGYAPDGSMVAAPTTSLPERIGGDRNWDYRYAWVRDASLSVAGLSLLGDNATATRYLDWLASLKSDTAMPLQVVYHTDGATRLAQHERNDLNGYRGSKPVRFGNRAFDQVQPGSLGYLADCALIHLEQGGQWKPEYWELIARCARYIAGVWEQPDNGIWELPAKEQYVGTKVMSWVVLDRAITIGERTGHASELDDWRAHRDAIHAQVLARGWSERQQTFLQRYGAEALDAATLLIPVMGFLPADDPRVIQMVDRIVESLAIDGLIYRFQPHETPTYNPENLPMGEYEGAFLPCSFWLATAYALSGRTEEANETLSRVEGLTNAAGLFAEEADARTGEMLGNYPLLFSQVEYVRAVLALAHAREAREQRPRQRVTEGRPEHAHHDGHPSRSGQNGATPANTKRAKTTKTEKSGKSGKSASA